MNYTFFNISTSVNVGDSLSTINANYSGLNAWVSEKQNDYGTYWNPIIDFYNQNIDYIKNALTLVNNNSAIWNDFRTVVQTNSAFWLAPKFTIYYPTIIDGSKVTIQGSVNNIAKWLNENFSIQNKDGSVNYVEGQNAIVYAYVQSKNKQINYSATLLDQTTCKASSQTSCATCYKTSNDIVECNQTTVACNYQTSCQTCVTGNCHYEDTPTTSFIVDPKDNTKAISEIKVKLSMKYTDANETLYGIVFKVANCQWVYHNYLQGQPI
jgi:hypothetical protein